MKRVGCVLVTLVLTVWAFGCRTAATPKPCGAPAWFSQTEDDGGLWTGVGEGASLEGARTAALEEISARMGTWVNSQSKGIAERNGTDSVSCFKHQVELESKHRLDNARRLNMERCADRYFVRYAVDMRPPSAVMAESLMDEFPGKKVMFSGSPALTRSFFAADVSRIVSGGATEKDSVISVPLSLTCKDGVFFVHGGRLSLPVYDVGAVVDLSVYVTDSVKFNVCERNGAVRSTTFKVGDTFVFSVEGTTGYLTLFNLYPDGRVSLVVANREIKRDKILFPDPSKDGQVLEASTVTPGSPSVDAYLAVICPSAPDVSDFAVLSADGTAVSGDQSFSARVLVDWLDSVTVKEVALLRTRTEP